ncbi:MAG: hypothetical protein H0T73_09940 [Ardenticatenales bacterium]|nr:hypothetical protein [Ardenticatenales bacterium]
MSELLWIFDFVARAVWSVWPAFLISILLGVLAQGMQPGAAIAFLIAGPVTTIPAMTAVWGIASRRVFALYLAVGLGGAMLAGFITTLLIN